MLRNMPARRSENTEFKLLLTFNMERKWSDLMPRMLPRAVQGVVSSTQGVIQCRHHAGAHCDCHRLNWNPIGRS